MPTMKTRTNRRARLEARTSRAQKALFEKAAAFEGRSLTDFVLASVRGAATRVVQEHEVLRLSMRDSKVFVTSLLSNAALRTKLRAAAGRFTKRTGA